MFGFLLSLNLSAQKADFTISEGANINNLVQLIPNDSLKNVYTKVVQWVNLVWMKPDNVLLSYQENDFIRIKGMTGIIWENWLNSQSIQFIIRIDIKKNKYRIVIEEIKIYNSYDNTFGDYFIIMNIHANKKKNKNNVYNNVKSEFNKINESLYNYLIGTTTIIKDNW